MKFGKSLSSQIEETLPEWRDKFLSYKDLKKRLKRIQPQSAADNVSHDDVGQREYPKAKRLKLSEEEADFMSLLHAELDKFNAFFVEKEEEYVIRQKELHDRMTDAANHDSEEQITKIRKEIVDFHGEMVLLENYSALNYTGLVKILKKYDKRTGGLLRLPFIRNVLRQPFFTTDLLYKLVKECEAMLDRIFPAAHEDTSLPRQEQRPSASSTSSSSAAALGKLVIPELEEIECMESMYMRTTISALRVLKDIRKGSSTVSVFSLPPLQQQIEGGRGVDGVDERWPAVNPVIQQEAK